MQYERDNVKSKSFPMQDEGMMRGNAYCLRRALMPVGVWMRMREALASAGSPGLISVGGIRFLFGIYAILMPVFFIS